MIEGRAERLALFVYTRRILPFIFAFVLAVVVAEIVLSAKWNRAYFTIGLPIFVKRVERPEGLVDVSFENLQKSMANAAGTPVVFHRFDTNLIAFREKTFSGMIHYAPLMRGVIRYRDGEPSVVLQGLVNWSFVALTLVLAAGLRGDFGAIAPYLLGTMAVLYLIQGVRFLRLAKGLRGEP